MQTVKPSNKILEMLKKCSKEYILAVERDEEDYVILNTYLNLLNTLTREYLKYKRKCM